MKKSKEKSVKFSYNAHERLWVGDGFFVHPILRPSNELNKYISPFILMDYASPREFASTDKRRGVGEHPHRGFETVTFAFQGEIEHRDSSGGGGLIKPGGVQWMTAGSGVVHDEFHSKAFAKKGGLFEMVQLWVNLPKLHKMTKPKYQGIDPEKIPSVKVSDDSDLRVISGEFNKVKGPASTFTPINIYDLKSKNSDQVHFDLKEKFNTVLLVLNGSVEIEGKVYQEHSILIFEQKGESLSLKTSDDSRLLIFNGEPINEPMIAHGPFVMNTKEEIIEAIEDFQNGKMGQL